MDPSILNDYRLISNFFSLLENLGSLWFSNFFKCMYVLLDRFHTSQHRHCTDKGAKWNSIFIHSLLFNLYMLPLDPNHIWLLITATQMTQISLITLSPIDYGPSYCQCIKQVNSWVQLNLLQLNKDKGEITVFGNKGGRKKVIGQLDSRAIKTKTQVSELCALIDSALSFRSHIRAITKSAF